MRHAAAVLLVALGSVAVGVALSFGQGLEVEAVAPLFNSALPVVTLAALAAFAGRGLLSCVVLAAVSGPLAMVGYYSTSVARGIGASSGSVLLWVVAGVVAGSIMGAAVWAMRQPRSSPPPAWLRGLAVGYWPGIALGEAAHGLVRISDTTPASYWWCQASLGVVVLVVLAWRCLDSVAARVAAAATAAGVAAALFVVYGTR